MSMTVAITIMSAFFGGGILLSLIYLFYRQAQNRKIARANILGLILDKTGSKLRFKILTKDREHCRDPHHHLDEEGNWQAFDYLAREGATPITEFPPFGMDLLKTTIEASVWIEGISAPPDILGTCREKTALGPLDNAALWANQRDEKISKYMMNSAEVVGKILEEIQAMRKQASPILLYVGLGLVIIISIATIFMLNGKINHLNETMTNLANNLTAILP